MFFNKMKKLGFTMIELLIVIAVLGVLAVAVLSAINPIEQINRGKDTGSRSDAEQLVSAIDRFYAAKSHYPWQIDADSTAVATTGMVELASDDVQVGADVTEMLTNLTSGGTAEIKASFVTRITGSTYRKLSIFNDGVSGSSTYVCFLPQSNSFKDEAWKRYRNVSAGTVVTMPSDFPPEAHPDADCTGATTAEAATACMICLP